MSGTHLLRDLVRLTDADALLPDGAGSFTHAVDAAAVVAPGSVNDVAAVLAFCSERGVPVLPAGAGGWLHDPMAGLVHEHAAPIVVSTRRLSGILEHEPEDLVIGVAAGTSLDDVARHLRGHAQMLPLDPPAQAGATIGATIALGAAGPLQYAHGLPRDMTLGLEVVTGDGRVLRFGGRVVKNVAGYDGVRLFTGSGGSLGIITAAYVRVRGVPATDCTLTVAAGSAHEAASVARAIAGAVAVDALEVVDGGTENDGTGEWLVVIRLAGSAAAVAAERDRLGALIAPLVPADVPAADNQGFNEGGGWNWRESSRAEAAASTHVRLQVQPDQLPSALQDMTRIIQSENGTHDGDWRFAAHAGSGVVRAWRTGVPLDLAAANQLAGHVTGFAVSCGGTAVCTLGGRLGRRTVHASGTGRDATMAIAVRLADAFDPAAVLRAGARLRADADPDMVEAASD